MAKSTGRKTIRLTVTSAEARKRIKAQLAKAQALFDVTPMTEADAEEQMKLRRRWDSFNAPMLTGLADSDDLAENYTSGSQRWSSTMNPSLADRWKESTEDLERGVEALEQIDSQLELYAEPSSDGATPVPRHVSSTPSREVFIVHGHDEALKHEVARYITALGLTPVILAEQVNAGRTIIEKFEGHAEPAAFAIVLLTPDDECVTGGRTTKRARQNVILELGYFFAKLGRAKVCALLKGDVEKPSDIHGILYVSTTDEWKLRVAKEMKSAGLDVDLNKAI